MLRYSALVFGIFYGFSHQRTITAQNHASHVQAEWRHKEDLIQKAKLEWKKKQNPGSFKGDDGASRDDYNGRERMLTQSPLQLFRIPMIRTSIWKHTLPRWPRITDDLIPTTEFEIESIHFTHNPHLAIRCGVCQSRDEESWQKSIEIMALHLISPWLRVIQEVNKSSERDRHFESIVHMLADGSHLCLYSNAGKWLCAFETISSNRWSLFSL